MGSTSSRNINTLHPPPVCSKSRQKIFGMYPFRHSSNGNIKYHKAFDAGVQPFLGPACISSSSENAKSRKAHPQIKKLKTWVVVSGCWGDFKSKNTTKKVIPAAFFGLFSFGLAFHPKKNMIFHRQLQSLKPLSSKAPMHGGPKSKRECA